MTTIITIITVLAVVGVTLWVVRTYVPLVPKKKTILNIAIVVVAGLWLLRRLIS